MSFEVATKTENESRKSTCLSVMTTLEVATKTTVKCVVRVQGLLLHPFV